MLAAHLFSPFYVLNGAALLSFVILRSYVWDGDRIAPLTVLDSWGYSKEQEILLILFLASVLRYRRAINFPTFITQFFQFSKIVVLWLSYMVDRRVAAWYFLVFTVLYFGVRRRAYVMGAGSRVTTIVSSREFHRAVASSAPGSYWLVAVTAGWSEPWINFSSSFAALALRYGNQQLRFGLIDISNSAQHADASRKPAIIVNNNAVAAAAAAKDGDAEEEDSDGDNDDADADTDTPAVGRSTTTTGAGVDSLSGLIARYNLPNPSSLSSSGADRIPTLVLFHRRRRHGTITALASAKVGGNGVAYELGRLPAAGGTVSKAPINEGMVVRYFSLAQRSAGEIASDSDLLAIGSREDAQPTAAAKSSRRGGKRR